MWSTWVALFVAKSMSRYILAVKFWSWNAPLVRFYGGDGFACYTGWKFGCNNEKSDSTWAGDASNPYICPCFLSYYYTKNSEIKGFFGLQNCNLLKCRVLDVFSLLRFRWKPWISMKTVDFETHKIRGFHQNPYRNPNWKTAYRRQ